MGHCKCSLNRESRVHVQCFPASLAVSILHVQYNPADNAPSLGKSQVKHQYEKLYLYSRRNFDKVLACTKARNVAQKRAKQGPKGEIAGISASEIANE
jgi:hypothetical protein